MDAEQEDHGHRGKAAGRVCDEAFECRELTRMSQ
jgi:hypothetical protein